MGDAGIVVESLVGESAAACIPRLARLRIAVFRDFPYLYDGDEAYEQRYLATYVASPGAVIVVARDGAEIVGAATALPMTEAEDAVRAPFAARGFDPDALFYFGESVLLPPWRGRGIGVRFFEHREAHARSFGRYRQATFCAVERAADDPRRPPGYVPLDTFWRRRGYRPLPEVETSFSWKEIGEAGETPKRMRFWIKDSIG